MAPSFRKSYVAGSVATVVTTAMMYFVSPRIAGAPVDIPAMLGTMLGGSWVVGLIAHFVIGILVLPLLYVWMYRWLMGTPAVRGITYGVLLWLSSQMLIGPLLGAGPFSAYAGGIPAVLDSLLLHLTYGWLLGMIAGRPVRTATAWMHPAELEAHWRRPSWASGGSAPTHWRIR